MIFCIEDDKDIRELVIYTLKNTGFDSIGFESGECLFTEIQKNPPQLILLDIMLPGQDGISILKKLRSDQKTLNIPVILLTAKGSEYDKVIGLDSGADDYITKPFGMMELISRIKALLRRTSTAEDEKDTNLTAGAVTLVPSSHKVYVNGQNVELTLKEFQLLFMLIENSGTVLTRDVLLEKIWGYDFCGETRTVDVHVRTLRSKLGEAGSIIETVRGVGYRIDKEYKG